MKSSYLLSITQALKQRDRTGFSSILLPGVPENSVKDNVELFESIFISYWISAGTVIYKNKQDQAK